MKEDKLKKYADYRFELWSILAEKSCIVLESELDEIQYLVLKNREYIEIVEIDEIEDYMATCEAHEYCDLKEQLEELLTEPDGMKKLISILQEII